MLTLHTRTHSESHRADETEHVGLYTRACFSPHCQRCFDPTNCVQTHCGMSDRAC